MPRSVLFSRYLTLSWCRLSDRHHTALYHCLKNKLSGKSWTPFHISLSLHTWWLLYIVFFTWLGENSQDTQDAIFHLVLQRCATEVALCQCLGVQQLRSEKTFSSVELKITNLTTSGTIYYNNNNAGYLMEFLSCKIVHNRVNPVLLDLSEQVVSILFGFL